MYLFGYDQSSDSSIKIAMLTPQIECDLGSIAVDPNSGIRAIDPSGKATNAKSGAESNRLGDLEQRLEKRFGDFTASIDSKFARHTEELITEMTKLMKEHMEAITRRLEYAGVLPLSVEGAEVFDEMPQWIDKGILHSNEDFVTEVSDEMSEPMVIDKMPKSIDSKALHFPVERMNSSQVAVEVFEEIPESRVRPVHSNFSPSSVVTAQDTLHPESNEEFAGFGGRICVITRGDGVVNIIDFESELPALKRGAKSIAKDSQCEELNNRKTFPMFGEKMKFIISGEDDKSVKVWDWLKSWDAGQTLGKRNLINQILVKVRLRCLTRQPEQPLPPPEPPPPYSAYKLPRWSQY